MARYCRQLLAIAQSGLLILVVGCSTSRTRPLAVCSNGSFVELPGSDHIVLGTPCTLGSDEYHEEEESRTVSLPNFTVAKCLTTAQEFCAFLNNRDDMEHLSGALWCDDSDYPEPIASIEVRDNEFAPRVGADHEPANRVTWLGAMEFCKWRSRNDPDFDYRLLSENEWEYMARGQGGRTWPWGEAHPDPSRGLMWSRRAYDPHHSWLSRPVGTFAAGATPEGVLDIMCFPLYEWCGDDTSSVQEWAPSSRQYLDVSSTDNLQCARGYYRKERSRVGLPDAIFSDLWHEGRTWSRYAVPGHATADSATCGFRVVRIPERHSEAPSTFRHHPRW
ncbi:MAG: formylglycine-generating enzyme family protein [Planctomycetota bacterium]